MSNPYFTIITPTYNRADKISKTIESVLTQKYGDFEYIIVDDGSEDDTKQIVNSYKDSRIRYFKKENGERGAARNYGILKATGKYICFLDSDDVYYENHLKEAHNFISQNNNVVFFYQPHEILLKTGKRIQQKEFFEDNIINRISFSNFLCPIGAVIRTDIATEHPFNEDPKFNIAEDLYVWLILGIRYGVKFSTKYTSCLVEHKGRTMENIDTNRLIYCTDKLVGVLAKDEEFSKRRDLILMVYASHLSLCSLYFSIQKRRLKSVEFLIKSSLTSFKSLFRKRTLVIVRNILLKW